MTVEQITRTKSRVSEKTGLPLHAVDATAAELDDGHGFHPDPIQIARLRRKIDWRLLPLLSLMYLCSFLDRVNIGNAKVAGLEADIGLTPSEYNWALSIFFIG
ncbi:hypothetical protein BGW38_005500 [Lunasporangiospora selenospora]|uniref:Major facilitator superfamily (MFS) profile domain-containing protein n=1 Tax=Lunasporangiospora selenospora TaxID=979761 RepID=A0A9P6FMZ1_9FUNG|nr:hypothetical protein BGW38_005500 [Lunasporangiospora selenospora]